MDKRIVILINKKNLTCFFIIIISSIILLEIILRISGAFYSSSIIDKQDYKGKTVIVCAGDSFTYGVGVPRGYDYPSILEKKLADENIKVINIGEPGANTSVIYNRLEKLLSKIRPEYVILMAGVNNLWNFKDKYENRNFFIKIISELKIIRLFRFLKYRDNKVLNTYGKKDIYELLYADNQISTISSSKKIPDISKLKYSDQKFELDYNSQKSPQNIINTLNSIQKLKKQDIIDYIISLINLGKYSQAYNFAQRFNKTIDKKTYERLMGLIVFYSGNKDYLINYIENIQYPKTSVEISRLLTSLKNNNFIEQKNEIEKNFYSVLSKSDVNSKMDKIIRGIDTGFENKEDDLFNIKRFLNKDENIQDKSEILSLCHAFFNSFEFSPSIPRLLKIPWDLHKDNIYNDFEENKIVDKFLNWIETIPDDIIVKIKSNLSGVYFKYAFLNTNSVLGLDLLLKAIELEPENIDFLKNLSYFSQNADVLQRRGQKIFSIISVSLKKELISPQLLKDMSMSIKKVYNGRVELIKLKTQFDDLYLKYKKDDENILTEYSDNLLRNSENSESELQKALEWHEKIQKKTNNRKILLNYGIILKKAKKTDRALDILNQLNSEYPDDKEIMIFLSYIYSELINTSFQKYLKPAEYHIKKTFKFITDSSNSRNTEYKDILEMLSILYLKKAQYNVEFLDTSIDWHENTVKENQFSELFYNYAVLLSIKDKNYINIELILKNIKTAVNLSPQNRKYYDFQKNILTEFSEMLALKDYTDNEILHQAINWHKKAIENYEYNRLKFNYAVLLRKNREYLKSLQIVNTLCQNNNNKGEYLTFLALLYSDYSSEISQSDYNQAEEILENGIKEISEYLKTQPEDNIMKQTIEKILFEYSNGLFTRLLDKSKDLNKTLKWHKDILNISQNNRVKYNYAVILQKDNKINESIELMEELYSLEPENPEYIMFLAYLYSGFVHNVNSEDFKKAENILKKAYDTIKSTHNEFKENQKNSILIYLSSLYLNKTRYDFRNIDQTLEWHEEAVKNQDLAELYYNYGVLISITGTDKKTTEKALSYIDKAIILKSENSEFKKTALELYSTRLKKNNKNTAFPDEIMKWIKNDIKKIFNILRSQNIKVVFMNYPDFQLDNTNEIIKDENIYFIDNMQYFNSLKDREELFFPDGHLNIEGNERLAENIAKFLKTNIIKSE